MKKQLILTISLLVTSLLSPSFIYAQGLKPARPRHAPALHRTHYLRKNKPSAVHQRPRTAKSPYIERASQPISTSLEFVNKSPRITESSSINERASHTTSTSLENAKLSSNVSDRIKEVGRLNFLNSPEMYRFQSVNHTPLSVSMKAHIQADISLLFLDMHSSESLTLDSVGGRHIIKYLDKIVETCPKESRVALAEFLISLQVPQKHQHHWESEVANSFKEDPDALLHLLPVIDKGINTVGLDSLCYGLSTTLYPNEILVVANGMSAEGKFLLTLYVFKYSEPNMKNMNLLETLLTEHQLDATKLLHKYLEFYPVDRSAKIALLLEHGANVQENFNNKPLIQLAFENFEPRDWVPTDAPYWQDFINTFRVLQAHHVNVNAPNADGNTILHVMAKLWFRIAYSYKSEHLREFNKFLVQEMGADLTIKNHDGLTPEELLRSLVTKEVNYEIDRRGYIQEKENPRAWNSTVNIEAFHESLNPEGSERNM